VLRVGALGGLKDIHISDDLSENVISVARLCRQGYKVVFAKDDMYLVSKTGVVHGNDIVLRARRAGGVYVAKMDNVLRAMQRESEEENPPSELSSPTPSEAGESEAESSSSSDHDEPPPPPKKQKKNPRSKPGKVQSERKKQSTTASASRRPPSLAKTPIQKKKDWEREKYRLNPPGTTDSWNSKVNPTAPPLAEKKKKGEEEETSSLSSTESEN
jgi:hypothetical protein